MNMLNLECKNLAGFTAVPNIFIDRYMPHANGDFVKIYLYLLKCVSSGSRDLSVCKMADVFNYTEKDILRALTFWEGKGLMTLTYDSQKHLGGIRFEEVPSFSEEDSEQPAESPQPQMEPIVEDKKKPVYSRDDLESFLAKEDISQLMYIIQKYLGKTLSPADTNTILYFYDVLSFPHDLIEYLFEYCVSKNHKSMRYIEKVALDWASHNICTVAEAKEAASLYSNSIFSVLKAFGISGRNPGNEEKAFIVKWTNSYGFDIDIIIEACNRTIRSIHQPSFEYADSILTKWKERGIHHLTEVQSLDEEHNSKKPAVSVQKAKNNFNSFSQRTYNYAELEKQLLNNN
ncbi:DnaD domain protein [Parasporobacterium paucivorans]|uniref:DnaD and phage-associated domain-containing protein n=1 Tax=Parasporobacterium paucivorans DSM 15970 TaxID=1122934 RepID=A0A1M6CSI2_9FIRM|nr:DnaD domain protein [Parasporobacterium paucivorans]SHI63919.1 DnaD and phage-associated domain-containing protein [Parasporobacterium paucivorans DSM 15970]